MPGGTKQTAPNLFWCERNPTNKPSDQRVTPERSQVRKIFDLMSAEYESPSLQCGSRHSFPSCWECGGGSNQQYGKITKDTKTEKSHAKTQRRKGSEVKKWSRWNTRKRSQKSTTKNAVGCV